MTASLPLPSEIHSFSALSDGSYDGRFSIFPADGTPEDPVRIEFVVNSPLVKWSGDLDICLMERDSRPGHFEISLLVSRLFPRKILSLFYEGT